MELQNFQYAIYRVGYRKPLKRGNLRKGKIEDAILDIQHGIKRKVLEQNIPLYVRVWNAREPTKFIARQYDSKRSFKYGKPLPDWRSELPRKDVSEVKTPEYVFVVITTWGRLDLTWLEYEPTKHSLLARKRRYSLGPFPDEIQARAFIEKATARIQESNYVFTQRRRYSGPMDK